MDWTSLIKVARAQLAGRIGLTDLSWGVLAIAFVVNLTVARGLSGYHGQTMTGGLATRASGNRRVKSIAAGQLHDELLLGRRPSAKRTQPRSRGVVKRSAHLPQT
jgi:hypothetical protein